MSTRRFLLASVLSSTVLAVIGNTVRAQPADPYAPWAAAVAAPPADWRLAAMRWAVLAPNPHNRQPWLARLVDADTVLVHCDLDRRLPETDPFDRQIAIGLGAFCELFRMAAAASGIAVVVETFPQGEPANTARLDARPVARIRRIPGTATPDPLFAHAAARRSAKRPYDLARPPAAAVLRAVAAAAAPQAVAATAAPQAVAATAAPQAVAAGAAPQAAGGRIGFVTEPAAVANLRALVWEAWLVEAHTPATHLETVNLMRLGSAAVAAQPDGVSVAGPGLDPLVERGVLTREAFAAPGRPGFEEMVQRYTPMLAATPAYVWTAGPAAGRAGQLAAGAQWLRLNLAATAAGLAVQPVSQALQEYPEMAPYFAQAHAQLGIGAPERLHMLARIGVLPAGDRAPPTPRWAAETRISA